MHFNSILWEEQLRNKGLQCGLTCFRFSLYYSRKFYSLFVRPSPSHLLTPYSPSGCPSFWPTSKFILRDKSQNTTWRFLLALPWPPRARESLNSGPLYFFLEALAHKVTETQRKGWRGLECGSGSGGRNVSSLFVSVCGAWWMRWVDVMTWLIAQTLNKSPILQQASPSGTPLPPSLLAASQRGRTLWLGGLEV